MVATFSMYNQDHDEYLTKKEKYTFSKKDKKPPTDDNAPKKPLSAFMLFCDVKRAKVMKELGEGTKVGEIQKKLGEMWKAAAGKGERTKLEEKATKAKAMYDRLFSAYKMSGNYQDHQERLHAFKIHKTKIPFRKDENMPKKALSGYMLYCNSERPTVMKQFAGKPITETIKVLSAQWNALDDKEKAKWQKKAEKAKADREKKVEEYMKGKERKQYLNEKKEYEEEMAEKRAALKKKGVKRQLEPEASKPAAKKAKRATSEPRAESEGARQAKKKAKKPATSRKPAKKSKPAPKKSSAKKAKKAAKK